ncbi:MAG: hypothetical protein J6T55_02345 [Alphaproteobacteria bacterium]|nr:hypothetical protein [Alphaproteobacteria bacterium]
MLYPERRKIIEQRKAMCRKEIKKHTSNVILQSLVSFACIAGGMYGIQKKNVIIPLIAAPSSAHSLSSLMISETKRRRNKDILKKLERQ